jgi:uncharacterized protein
MHPVDPYLRIFRDLEKSIGERYKIHDSDRSIEVPKVMKYFAAFLSMKDPAKNQEYRPAHLEFLGKMEGEGKIFARGKFSDGSGGLVIYKAESAEEARQFAESDPYVRHGARTLELHEWDMKFFG